MKWIDCLRGEMSRHGEVYPDDIEKIVVNGCRGDDDEDRIADPAVVDILMNRNFDGGFGCIEGNPLFAWSKNRVYFCHAYDGAEGVESVPRNPCEEVPYHIGR